MRNKVVALNKLLVWDMDNTLNLFYDEPNWLEDLRTENVRPYVNAKPKLNMNELRNALLELKKDGWKVVITSWLAKDATKEYDNAVREAKRDWLNKYNFPYDELHLVKYGTTKADCTRHYGGYQILFDDNAMVRKGWHLGATVNADGDDVMGFLKGLTQ